jgi:hypothetical protein
MLTIKLFLLESTVVWHLWVTVKQVCVTSMSHSETSLCYLCESRWNKFVLPLWVTVKQVCVTSVIAGVVFFRKYVTVAWYPWVTVKHCVSMAHCDSWCFFDMIPTFTTLSMIFFLLCLWKIQDIICCCFTQSYSQCLWYAVKNHQSQWFLTETPCCMKRKFKQ